ncbi:Nitric oxide synthase [Gracilariopsis chorda]|uniref:Nitric oxide synthase n=1 Tax=Gracilariopsis chorda TaxID=448386 RepID=A0A2V3IY24_9FLOR|nr:Nitric oxide synthase [Gracilariopsis chorda]|eukprot:PXF47009.1 Nitric oxide synthase [Gracilariopsis chorda]
MSSLSPSYAYLYSSPNDNGKSFLSVSNGFLPSGPLPFLPHPFSLWHALALQLPSIYDTNSWNSFISSLPDRFDFDVVDLADEHLLRANIALGSMAHAIYHVAKRPIPECISVPWMEVSERLGRDMPCLASIDFLVYNTETLPELCFDKIEYPYKQVRPSITMTPLRAEKNYIIKGYSIEHAARPLASLIAEAQNAVVNDNTGSLREALVKMVTALEGMAKAFTEADPRPFNHFCVDPVDWSRSIDISAAPVKKGERGGSGLLFPSIHLLDSFFCRKKYESEIGKLALHERSWLPRMHREFFAKVAETSTMDYLLAKGNSELLALFRRALLSFAGETGFLGKHRIRLNTYLEVMFKIGRAATGGGHGSSGWEGRIWRRLNLAMRYAMRERIGLCEDWYNSATIKEVSHIDGSDATRVVIEGHGAFLYKPGDHLGVLPENGRHLVAKMLRILQMDFDQGIVIRNPEWLRLLACRGVSSEKTDNQDELCITADKFFRYAKLQPLDAALGSRLITATSTTDISVIKFLTSEHATNVIAALELLQRSSGFRVESMKGKLDELLQPLTPRYYSVASHMSVTPTSAEIIVGKLQYEATPVAPTKDGIKVLREGNRNAHSRQLDRNVNYDVPDPRDVQEFRLQPTLRSPLQGFQKRIDRDCEVPQCRAKELPQEECGERNAPSFYTPDAKEGNTHFEKGRELLEGISSSYLCGLSPGHSVTVRVVPCTDFHLPTDETAPIIMVSQGTGFAPCRPFLNEIILQKERGQIPRKAWIILGVKSRRHIPFIEDIEQAVCKDKIANISLAVSREDVELDTENSAEQLAFRRGHRKHVQDLFEEDAVLLDGVWEMVRHGGHMYVCGKPELEIMVRDFLKQAARKHISEGNPVRDVNGEEIEADHFADWLMANRRIHIDCYNSGKDEEHEKLYNPSEVAKHRSVDDCWVSFRNDVFDISRYLQVHPGGPQILLDKAGRDISMDFNAAHGVDNYRVASMLDSYKIGRLEMFCGGDGDMTRLLKNWGLPLLNGIQERRNVFLLEWNHFPKLEPPRSVNRMHACRTHEMWTLYNKFFDTYEVGMFGFVKEITGRNLRKELDEMSERCIAHDEFESTLNHMNKIRNETLSRARCQQDEVGHAEVVQMLTECGKSLDVLVDMAVKMVGRIEQGSLLSRDSDTGLRVEDIMKDVICSLMEGVEQFYGKLPLKR